MKMVLLILALLVAGTIVMWRKMPAQYPGSTLNQVTSSTTEAVGFATTTVTEDKQILYRNTFVGFNFILPTGWHIDHDTLGNSPQNGTWGDDRLELANFYPPKDTGAGKDYSFATGTNGITIVTTPSSYIATSSDYIALSRTESKTIISGRNSTETNITLLNGDKSRFYMVPLNSDKGFLRLGVYGDPKNFYILDNLVQSLKFE